MRKIHDTALLDGRTVVDLPERRGVAGVLLRRGYALRVEFTGTSMRPLFRRGDRLLVLSPGHPPRRGEILLYSREDLLIVHRFLFTGEEGYRLKGDTALGSGEWVSPEAVVGRVVGLERGGERVRLDRGAFSILHPLAALASPWLPGLVRSPLLRPLRSGLSLLAARFWNAAK